MLSNKTIQEERTQLFKNVFDGKVPKRVPIDIDFSWDAAIEYAELDLKTAQWDMKQWPIFYEKMAQEFQNDKLPLTRSNRTPRFYQILQAKSFVMSDSGYMQHPEISCLEVDEYDEFIKDPYNFMTEVLLPRLYPSIQNDTIFSALNFAKAYKAYHDSMQYMTEIADCMTDKYGYAVLPPGAGTEAPFDYLADLIRSFTNINKDIRRCPQKVEEACEALLPLTCKAAIGPVQNQYARCFIPLHMAPFLNKKQFERFWWPTFQKLMKYIFENNMGAWIFCEHDWSDKLDYLAELEGRVYMCFEYGDPSKIKKIVGKNHIVSGLYPISYLQTKSKQECIDEAKRLLDIMAPGGGYIFSTDKIIFSLKGQIAENLKAVLETVREYGQY